MQNKDDLEDSVVGWEDTSCNEMHRFLTVESSHQLAKQIQSAVDYIRDAFTRFSRVAFSFNGGKDCTVVLHLIRLAAWYESQESQLYPTYLSYLANRVLVFFLKTTPQFEEVEEFMTVMNSEYSMNTEVLIGPSFKDLLVSYIDEHKPQAVFTGVRACDPNGKVPVFAPPSPGWPEVVRVSPVLYWSYTDVWDFLLRFQFPYCPLYNYGFTSLGSSVDTTPHPSLIAGSPRPRHSVLEELERRGLHSAKKLSQLQEDGSRPAFMLPVSESERHGRGKK